MFSFSWAISQIDNVQLQLTSFESIRYPPQCLLGISLLVGVLLKTENGLMCVIDIEQVIRSQLLDTIDWCLINV